MREVRHTAHLSLLICMYIVTPIVDSQHGQISHAYKGSVARDHPKWWRWQVFGGGGGSCPGPTEMDTRSVLCIIYKETNNKTTVYPEDSRLLGWENALLLPRCLFVHVWNRDHSRWRQNITSKHQQALTQMCGCTFRKQKDLQQNSLESNIIYCEPSVLRREILQSGFDNQCGNKWHYIQSTVHCNYVPCAQYIALAQEKSLLDL